MDISNLCANRGYLVGARRELPTDESDFSWDGRQPAVGCNRLKCSACGAMVRQRSGWLVDRDVVRVGAPDYRVRIDELYDRDDWRSLSSVRPDETYRVYVCRCGFVTESGELALAFSTSDGIAGSQNTIPWSCDGHRPVTLPFALDGEVLATEGDIVDKARRAFAGWLPSALVGPVHGTWTSRLYGRSSGTPFTSTIEALTVRSLSDADLNVRAGALRFLRTHRNPEGFAAAVELALARRAEFRGSPATERELLETVARIYELDLVDVPALQQFVRTVALEPGNGDCVIEALAVRTPGWLRDSAEAIVRANPLTAGLVLKAVFDAFASEGFTPSELAGRLARIPGVSREQMRADARRWLRGDARDAVLQAIDAAGSTVQ